MSLKSFLLTLKDEAAAQAVIEAAKAFFKGVVSSAGEDVGKRIPQTVEDYMTIKFGLKTEDERLYNAAKRKMKLADRIRLGKKIMTLAATGNAKLTDERFNYFRICLPLKDVNKTADILTGYAQLSTEAWDRECLEMGFRFEHDGISVDAIIDALKNRREVMNTAFTAHPVRQQIKTYRDTAKDRADNQSW